DEYRSSTSATSSRKRRLSSAAKLRAALVMSLSEPSTLYGSPTTARSGCQSWSGGFDSGIAAYWTDSRQFHAQKASRGFPARLKRQFKNQTQVNRRAEPGICPNLFLQLTAIPACV